MGAMGPIGPMRPYAGGRRPAPPGGPPAPQPPLGPPAPRPQWDTEASNSIPAFRSGFPTSGITL